MKEYLIWSIEHQAFWLESEYGYTRNIHEAGRFTKEQAEKIVKAANIIKIDEVMLKLC